MINMQVDNSMKEEVLTRLDVLAAKLGVAADHLWMVFTQQALLEGVGGVLLLLVMSLVSVLLLCKGLKNTPLFTDQGCPNPSLFFVAAGGLVGLVVFIIGADNSVTFSRRFSILNITPGLKSRTC